MPGLESAEREDYDEREAGLETASWLRTSITTVRFGRKESSRFWQIDQKWASRYCCFSCASILSMESSNWGGVWTKNTLPPADLTSQSMESGKSPPTVGKYSK